MKRNILWLLSTLTVLVLLFGYHTSTSGAMATSAGGAFSSSSGGGGATTTSGSGGSGSGGSGGSGGGGSGGSGGSGTAAGSGSGSGSGSSSSTRATPKTVTGDTVQTQWGPVQVQLVVANGTITKVNVLQYPNGNGQDQAINSYALPILIQDTMQAQSANIDMVSGATYTSGGYLQSLQSALDRAGL